MKRSSKIVVMFRQSPGLGFAESLKALGINKKAHGLFVNKPKDFFEWTLLRVDPLHDASIALAKNVPGSEVRVQSHVYYDASDFEHAAYLVVGFEVQPKGDAGVGFGTEYDLSKGCPKCGCGSEQASPLRIGESMLPVNRPLAQTFQQHLLVKDYVAEAIREVTGSWDGLRHIEDVSSHKPLPWYQMLSRMALPSLSNEGCPLIPEASWFCTTCRRSGFAYDGGVRAFEPVIRMRQSAFIKLPDISELWEHGECWLNRRRSENVSTSIATPSVCISQRVYRVFRKLKLDARLFLTPIRFDLS